MKNEKKGRNKSTEFKISYGYRNQDLIVLVDRHMDQWSRTENPEIDPYTYAQLIFDKGTQASDGAKTAFSTNDGGHS